MNVVWDTIPIHLTLPLLSPLKLPESSIFRLYERIRQSVSLSEPPPVHGMI
jgi:hypothetical protein